MVKFAPRRTDLDVVRGLDLAKVLVERPAQVREHAIVVGRERQLDAGGGATWEAEAMEVTSQDAGGGVTQERRVILRGMARLNNRAYAGDGTGKRRPEPQAAAVRRLVRLHDAS